MGVGTDISNPLRIGIEGFARKELLPYDSKVFADTFAIPVPTALHLFGGRVAVEK